MQKVIIASDSFSRILAIVRRMATKPASREEIYAALLEIQAEAVGGRDALREIPFDESDERMMELFGDLARSIEQER